LKVILHGTDFTNYRRTTLKTNTLIVVVVVAHSNSVLGLVEHGVLVLVRVAAHHVTDSLGARFLAVGLHRRRGGVHGALHFVGGLIHETFLRVGLHSRASLVGEGLTTGVGHVELIKVK